MMTHPYMVENLYKDRIDRLSTEVGRLRLIREALAGRPQEKPAPAGEPHLLQSLQAALAAMTHLWGVASS
jgi:hypothetical protein